MGLTYLWDTNIVIYYLQNLLPPQCAEVIDNILKVAPPTISAITEIELLSWKTPNQQEKNILLNFISDSFIVELDKPVRLKAAEIRSLYKTKLADAAIAASAIVYKHSLITRNVSDFKKIEGLNIIDPWNGIHIEV